MFRPRDKDLTKNKLTRSWTSLLSLLIALAGLPCGAQEIVLIEEAADVEIPAGEAAVENSPADWFSLDKEYRSGAVAGEEAEIRKEVELARNQFKAREWVAGQALIDGVLARITSADYRKQRLLKAARKLRELEKLPAKKEPPNPAGKRPANQQQATDDLRIPTAEVYSIAQVRYLPLPDAMRELLLALPEEARTAYRATYNAPARQALEAARKLPFNESHEALRAVAERYPLTRAGREAWERLAGRLADSGRLAEAAAALATRLELPFDTTSSSSRQETLAQAAVLNLMAGNMKSGQRYLDEIVSAHPDKLVQLRGEALLGASLADSPLLKSLAEYARTSAAAPSQWPAPLGGYDHAGAPGNPDKLPLLGTEARWIHHFRNPSTPTSSSTGIRAIVGRGPIAIKAGRTSSSLYRGSHPALQLVSNGGNIFFREGTSLVSLDARTGKRKWTHLLEQADNKSLPQGRFTTQRISPGQEDYSDLGTRSLCIYKDSEGHRRIVMLDHSTRIGFLRSGQAIYRQNRLLCFDAENGKLVWRAGKTEDKRDPIYGLAFTAPPTPAGGLLVAPAVRESGFYIAGITYEGTIKWLTRLYSFNSSYYQGYGKQFLMGSSLAASDGIAYSAPGTGMICAVEASEGRLLWMTRYRSANRERPGNTWVHSQPVVVSGAKQKVLLAAPADSNYLTSFDAGNGRLLWERSFTTTSNQLLGADEEKIYISGSSAMALSLANGEEVWKTKPTGSAAGMGCLVGGHIYLPRSYQTIVKLEREKGTILEKLRFRDERVPGKFNNSLFAIDDQLLSLGGWGIASILPQQESWTRFAGKPGARRFEQARLLESEGKYTESLEIYYELLGKVKSSSFRKRLRDEIISAVTRITAENGDPAPIDRMLSYGRTGRKTPLISKRTDYLRWRLKEASLLLKKSPARAAVAYTALLSEDGKFALSGDGNLVDTRLYSIDVLRRLRYDAQVAAEDEEPAAADELKQALGRLLSSEDKRFEEMLSGEPGEEALRKIALFGAHTPSAAEAQARLAVIELAAGHPQNARSHLRMLCRDYPVLAGLPEISRLLKQTVTGDPEARPLKGIRQPEKETPLKQAYWLSEDEGTLIGAAAGTEPFPVTFSLKANKLVATDQAGNTVMERTLTGFPKIDNIKTRLKSNIEEPAVAHIAGDRMVLFTAAGCYAFELPLKSKPADGDEEDTGGHEAPFNATGFKLAWVQNYPHALEKYRQRRAVFGSIRTS
ncbi:MAG: PQQ-binding-like beta-propeller repeat protein, partial [Planctomycetota bacterium]